MGDIPRFEPWLAESESTVLPLDDPPRRSKEQQRINEDTHCQKYFHDLFLPLWSELIVHQ